VRLAEEFGTSRTPIREALVRLEGEALVERHEAGGFFPRSPNLLGTPDLYEARAIIEREALLRERDGRQAHDPEALERLKADWEALAADAPETDPSFAEVDEEFHVRLAEAAGNPVLADLLRLLNERIRMVRAQDFLIPGRIRDTIEQHLALVQALLDGDVPSAARLLERHLGESRALVEERAREALARMLASSGASVQGLRR
jgi:DNA-binding GntR family transcriptional regulator